MKEKYYILVSFYAFLLLIICIMPELACVREEKKPNVHPPDPNLLPKPTNKIPDRPDINNPGDINGMGDFNKGKNTFIKTSRLQYTQLLENHRSYFADLLFTLSVYLAVMSACFTIVCNSIEKMKEKRIQRKGKVSSRTLLFVLIFFATAVSGLFMTGLYLGKDDAIERTSQIRDIAHLIGVAPIKIELLENLFRWIMVGPMLVIAVWFTILLRGLIECGLKQSRMIKGMTNWSSLLIGITWIVGYILYLLTINKVINNLCLHELFKWVSIASTIIVVIWFIVWFAKGIMLCHWEKADNNHVVHRRKKKKLIEHA